MAEGVEPLVNVSNKIKRMINGSLLDKEITNQGVEPGQTMAESINQGVEPGGSDKLGSGTWRESGRGSGTSDVCKQLRIKSMINGADGNIRRCKSCDSMRRMLLECSDGRKIMLDVHVTELEAVTKDNQVVDGEETQECFITEEKHELKLFRIEAKNCGALNSCCTGVVWDEQWIRLFLVSMEQKDMDGLKHASRNNACFMCGQTTTASFLSEAQDLYKMDAFSKSVVNWNKLRSDADEMALKKMLFPQLQKDTIHIIRGVDGIKKSIQRTLYEWIQFAPHTNDFSGEDDDWDCCDSYRILGISYSDDMEEAAYDALISLEGEVADFSKLSYLLCRRDAHIEKECQGKADDRHNFRHFFRQKKPHVITIAANDMNARGVLYEVQEVLKEEDDFPDTLEAHLLENSLVKVYANTNKASSDFCDYPQVLKEAISIRRIMQDPLIEFGHLYGPEYEILCMRYHPMQDLAGEEGFLEAVNLEFINRVNEVGVDINECVSHQYKSNLVQFVDGLGPRKGANLLKTLRRMTHPRQQLVTKDRDKVRAVTKDKQKVDDEEMLKKRMRGKVVEDTVSVKISNTDEKTRRMVSFDTAYACIYSIRDNDVILFHHEGGVDIGNADSKGVNIEVEIALYKQFVALQFTFMEINPLVVTRGKVYILDLAAKLDATA